LENPSSVIVRIEGLEPPRLTALDPKSSAAANYAISAKFCPAKIIFFLIFYDAWKKNTLNDPKASKKGAFYLTLHK
jgi:hypothetical protein